MTLLADDADCAVRDAVEQFLDGRRRPAHLPGEAQFETRNNRYRMLDGVLFSANDPALLGAEFVGWLLEGPERAIVQETWITGARAVLVDRRRGRQIIVTSTSRVLRVGQRVTGPRAGSLGHQPARTEPTRSLPPPASPPRLTAIPRCPPLPIGRVPGTTELSVATALLTPSTMTHASPTAIPPPPRTPSAQRVHAPPRLAAKASRSEGRSWEAARPATASASTTGPLPPPMPPPRPRAVPEPMEDAETEDPTRPHVRDELPLASPSQSAPPKSGLRHRPDRGLAVPAAPPTVPFPLRRSALR